MSEANLITLKDLLPGEKGKIVKVSAKGALYRRILDMGITRGVEIEVVRAAPLGDPLEIIVKGCHLSLRKSEAVNVRVKRIDKK
ncbi:MAG: ferrous iron transport protein A [Candidatus Omnitrophica bacterium]|nr:ferrous iron transport protein A [Candidatus Omnitrophota bacterium]